MILDWQGLFYGIKKAVTIVTTFFAFYSWEIAPVGQVPAHVPQSTQVPASITYWLSPWEIAPTGHSGSHEPQLTQESEITYAILNSLLKIIIIIRSSAIDDLEVHSNTKIQALQV